MKKNMMKWLLTLMVVVWAGGATAQTRLSAEQKEALLKQVETYRAELNLSEEQQEKVKAINTQYAEGLAALKNAGGSRMEKFKRFRTLSETRDAEMKNVLDKEQYKRYKELQQDMRQEIKSRRKR